MKNVKEIPIIKVKCSCSQISFFPATIAEWNDLESNNFNI